MAGAGHAAAERPLRASAILAVLGIVYGDIGTSPLYALKASLSHLSGAGGVEHPLYATYALVLATFLGTMGLPHVLVRFYTNPDGRAARRTTLIVLALLGAFYLLPSLYGALGRLYVPELLLTGRTDAVVLALPVAALSGTTGLGLQALLVAGAFAAFLSTSSGLLVTTAGVLARSRARSTDVTITHTPPSVSRQQSRRQTPQTMQPQQ